VVVTFYNEAGAQTTSEQLIPGFSRGMFTVPAGFGGFGFTVDSVNSVPVVAEHVIYGTPTASPGPLAPPASHRPPSPRTGSPPKAR
jgi:hypothetical protein